MTDIAFTSFPFLIPLKKKQEQILLDWGLYGVFPLPVFPLLPDCGYNMARPFLQTVFPTAARLCPSEL